MSRDGFIIFLLDVGIEIAKLAVLLFVILFLIQLWNIIAPFQGKLFEDGSFVITGCLPWMSCID